MAEVLDEKLMFDCYDFKFEVFILIEMIFRPMMTCFHCYFFEDTCLQDIQDIDKYNT